MKINRYTEGLINNQAGFTIIELLVVINISFIAITFIIGFYLFVTKFAGNLKSNEESECEIYNNIFMIEQVLNSSTDFTISSSDSGYKIVTEDSLAITISNNKIGTNRGLIIDGLKYINASVKLSDGTTKVFTPRENIVYDNYTLAKNEIRQLEIDFSTVKNDYSIIYLTLQVSVDQFKNITYEN